MSSKHWNPPYKSKRETHIPYKLPDGRIRWVDAQEATGATFLEFFSNLATVGLWTYYLAKLVPFMNHFLPGGIFFLVCIVWQNESETRWPLRCLTWALFWGAYFSSYMDGFVVAP